MEIGSICSREVDTIQGTEKALVAAQRMLQRNVGSLVVVAESGVPVGIVTDRDLTIRVLARSLSPDTPISEVMTEDPHCVKEGYVVEAALNTMLRTPCRRLPVVDDDGVLIGILTLDDIHEYHAEEATMMGGVLRRERPEEIAEP